MKRIFLLVILATTVGCRKGEDGSVGMSSITVPGMCAATVTNYSGAIVDAPRQTVPTNYVSGGHVAGSGESDPRRLIDGAEIDVRLCKGADCSTHMPSVHIYMEGSSVGFADAYSAGFTSYEITTTVCQ